MWRLTNERGEEEDCVKEGGGGQGEREEKGSARRSVHWGCHYATALDIQVDSQRRRLRVQVSKANTCGFLKHILLAAGF